MKITIDTKEDSAEDIKRVVRMLQAWTEGHSNQPFNMFSDTPSSTSGSSDSSSSNSLPMNEGLFNLFNDDKKDDRDDSPEIINLDEDSSGNIPPIITY